MIEKEDGILFSVEEAAKLGSFCSLAICFCEHVVRTELHANVKIRGWEERVENWKKEIKLAEKYKKELHDFYRTKKGFGDLNEG